jgi:uncharacterized protein (TIGR02757 family)
VAALHALEAPHPGRRLGLSIEQTRRLLDGLARTYTSDFLDTDPLGIVRRFDDPSDREIAGLLAAGLAYGRVRSIRASLDDLFLRIGTRPGRFVDAMDPRRDPRRFDGFVHRFTTGAAVAVLLWRVRRIREEASGLEECFVSGDPDPGGPTVGPAVDAFVARLFSGEGAVPGGRADPRGEAGARWLVPAPAGGSACKRTCLFLRWMVRPDDGVDCGVWSRVRPARLVLPLDTHVQRVVRALGWSRRATPGWAMALEATACLRRLDPEDPVRFDFALSRLGILGLLPSSDRVRARDVAAAMGR